MSSSQRDSIAPLIALDGVLEAGKTPQAGGNGGELEPQQSADRDWDLAEERVLLYLRALRIPAPRRLKLALEALERAAADEAAGRQEPLVTRAMQVLRALVTEQELSAMQNLAGQFQDRREQVQSRQPAPQEVPETADGAAAVQNRAAAAGTLRVAPPVKRAAMVPGHMDRKPWRSLLSERFRRSGRKQQLKRERKSK